MSFDDDSLIMRKITPVKPNRMSSNNQVPDVPTVDIGKKKDYYRKKSNHKNVFHNNKNNQIDSDRSVEDSDGDNGGGNKKSHSDGDCEDDDGDGGGGGEEEEEEEDDDDDDDIGVEEDYCGGGDDAHGDENHASGDIHAHITDAGKVGMVTNSAFSIGSISSMGFGSRTSFTDISVSSSAKDSIMKRLLLNIAVHPEPLGDIDDVQSTLTSNDLPEIERPKKRSKQQRCLPPPQCFPDKSLPMELWDDFIAYTKEYKTRQRYEMGKYSDVMQIIMNYALNKYVLLKKFLHPEQLNIRWMFEFWRSKEVREPSLHGGRNEYSQEEERAIERGLYKYPPYEETNMKGKKIFVYRWSKIFWDEKYHELLKGRSPQSIKDKARGTRNREGESILSLYHVQCDYRFKLHRLERDFAVELEKKKMEMRKKKMKL